MVMQTVRQGFLDLSDDDFDLDTVSPLHGKRILFVMGGDETKLLSYKRAYALGVKMVVLDGLHHWTQNHVSTGLFEAFIEVDLTERVGLLDDVLDATYAMGLDFDAVATFWEFGVTLTAQIAAEMKLPGHPIHATIKAHNKYQTRERWAAAGIPTPRFAKITSFDDLESAANHVGFPAVLKPVRSVETQDAYFVSDVSTLYARYKQIMEARRSTIQTEDLNSDGKHVLDLIWRDGFDMILEEYLDGDEFDIDCLLSNGDLVFHSVTSEDPQPNMVETGASLPASYPREKQVEMVAMTHHVLTTLGFTDGAFHVEMNYTSNGPRLLEVNACIGGGHIYKMIKWVWGVDMVEQYLLTCIGVPIKPEKPEEPIIHLAVRNLLAPYSGVITRDNFLSHLRYDPCVVLFKSNVMVGQSVIGADRGVPECLGEIIVRGEDSEQAHRILEEIISEIELPISIALPV